jgi:hypothetical protein
VTTSTNATTCGRGTSWRSANSSHGHGGRSRGSGRGPAPGGSCSGSNSTSYHHAPGSSSTSPGGNNHPQCQVCLKISHTANVCWYRFDEEYVPDNSMVAMAFSSMGNDPNWYLDSGATDHITSELEKLTLHDHYNGADQIRVANGASMDMLHTGKSIILSSSRPLYLNQVIHVPNAHKQLVSIHRFTLDNNTFIELHPTFFLIKDTATKMVLLRGPCKGGLYPIPQHLLLHTHKLLLSTVCPLSQCWHDRLGHPSRAITLHVIRNNNLLCSSFVSPESICDACLHAKAH